MDFLTNENSDAKITRFIMEQAKEFVDGKRPTTGFQKEWRSVNGIWPLAMWGDVGDLALTAVAMATEIVDLWEREGHATNPVAVPYLKSLVPTLFAAESMSKLIELGGNLQLQLRVEAVFNSVLQPEPRRSPLINVTLEARAGVQGQRRYPLSFSSYILGVP